MFRVVLLCIVAFFFVQADAHAQTSKNKGVRSKSLRAQKARRAQQRQSRARQKARTNSQKARNQTNKSKPKTNSSKITSRVSKAAKSIRNKSVAAKNSAIQKARKVHRKYKAVQRLARRKSKLNSFNRTLRERQRVEGLGHHPSFAQHAKKLRRQDSIRNAKMFVKYLAQGRFFASKKWNHNRTRKNRERNQS